MNGNDNTLRRSIRVCWTLLSVFCVTSIIVGVSVLPAALFWQWHFSWPIPNSWLRVVLLAMAAIPVYMIFACTLMILAALATRMLGWRTPLNAEMNISELGWPLLTWVRYIVITYVVRILAGALFRATPVWNMYLRLNGARIGRGSFINTLAIMDHNLLEIGDNTVIGSDVHMSGHMAENGVVKTARLVIGKNVTLGTQSVIGLGAQIGDGAQVGALSFVPKYARLEAGGVYAGIPVQKLDGRYAS